MNVVDRRPHRTRQIQPWHELFLIPLFALARPSSFSMGFWGLLLFYEVEAVAIFPNPLNSMMVIAQATRTWKTHHASCPAPGVPPLGFVTWTVLASGVVDAPAPGSNQRAHGTISHERRFPEPPRALHPPHARSRSHDGVQHELTVVLFDLNR